jgi:hypothetical protein
VRVYVCVGVGMGDGVGEGVGMGAGLFQIIAGEVLYGSVEPSPSAPCKLSPHVQRLPSVFSAAEISYAEILSQSVSVPILVGIRLVSVVPSPICPA